MKVSLGFPNEKFLIHFLSLKKQADYSYQPLLGTQSASVKGFDNDLNGILLGKGEHVWDKAKEALKKWEQFPPEWTRIYNASTPLEKGQTVAVLFKLFGIWWINSARIIYNFDEDHRFGFAYGTLEGHVEKGEECFWIEKDEEGNIYYKIKAFSKPEFWGAKLAYPLARAYQRRFVKDSMNRMKSLSS